MGQGHILDASTFALWRMDDSIADPRTQGPLDSSGVRWTFPSGGSVQATGPRIGFYSRLIRNQADSGVMKRLAVAGDAAKAIGSWTCEALLMVQSFTTTSTVLTLAGAADDSSANTNAVMSVRVETTGRLHCFWESGVGVNQSAGATTGALTLNQWHHIAVVKDHVAKTFTFWLDGVQQGLAIGYATEATGGSAAHWIIGQANDGGGGIATTMRVRDVQFATTKRAAPWLLANAAFASTLSSNLTAALLTDADTYFSVLCDAVAAVDEVGTYHLISRSGVLDEDLAYPTDANGGLIADGGRAKYFDNCTLQLASFSTAVRDVLLSSFTIEMWILPAPTMAVAHGLFCHGDPGVDTQAFNYLALDRELSGSVTFDIENGAGLNQSICSSSGGSVPSGRRTHLAARKTSLGGGLCNMALFVNGVKNNETLGVPDYDGGTDPSTTFLTLGRGSDTVQNRFAGFMDDVRLSSVARSDAEILESYQRGGAFSDASPPTITIISPTPGVAPGDPGGFPADLNAARHTPIVLTITDLSPGLGYICVIATLPGGVEEVVYRRDAFRGRYAGLSSVIAIANGLQFSVRHAEGWPPGNVTFAVDPSDLAGNLSA